MVSGLELRVWEFRVRGCCFFFFFLAFFQGYLVV